METTAARMGRGEDAVRRHVQRAIRELMTDNRPHTEILTVPYDRPDPRNGGQTLAHRVVLVPRENLRFELSDPPPDIFDLADDYLQHLASNIRDTPVHLVHDNRNQSCHFVQT